MDEILLTMDPDYVPYDKLREVYFWDCSISHIPDDPELAAWNSKGLSFYENISLRQAILTDQVIGKIVAMQNNEVKVIKDNAAWYVVRVKSPVMRIVDKEPVLLNLLMVYEISLSLWDKWEYESPKYSSPAELYPFRKIRLAMVFNDSDAPNDTFTERANSAGRDWWKNADEMPEFLLDMRPNKKGISWPDIRYILSQ